MDNNGPLNSSLWRKWNVCWKVRDPSQQGYNLVYSITWLQVRLGMCWITAFSADHITPVRLFIAQKIALKIFTAVSSKQSQLIRNKASRITQVWVWRGSVAVKVQCGDCAVGLVIPVPFTRDRLVVVPLPLLLEQGREGCASKKVVMVQCF